MIEMYLEDIRKSKWSILVLIIQMTFTLLITSLIFGLIFDCKQENAAMEKLLSNGRVLKAVESLDEIEFTKMTDEKEAELESLYQYLTENDKITDVLASIGLDFNIDINKTGKNLRKISRQFLYYDGQTGTCERAIVNENFFIYYNVHGDFEPEYDRQAVYLGHNFKSIFKKGDVIYDAYGRGYVVKGFLDKGSFYINPYEKCEKYNLDSFIITTVSTDGYTGLDYIMMVESIMLILKDDSAYDGIKSKIEELGLEGITLRDYSGQKDSAINDMLNTIITYSIVGIIVLLFATMSMIASMINYIRKSMLEFAVCMMCGATRKSIVIRVGIQLVLIIAVSSAITLLWNRFSIYSLEACAVGLIYAMLVLLYPAKTVSSLEISEIIRRK